MRSAETGAVAGLPSIFEVIEPSPWMTSSPSWPKISSSPAPPAM
jgi:hypothetical protein